MTDQPRTRQELYDRISQVGREEFILEEMIRYGFWAPEGTIPSDPADEIRRRGEITRELQTLRQESRKLQDEQKLRKQMLKQRLEESRRKRQENKERREKERLERAERVFIQFIRGFWVLGRREITSRRVAEAQRKRGKSNITSCVWFCGLVLSATCNRRFGICLRL